jgi:hypothetical protein
MSRVRAWLEDRAERQPFTPRGERRRLRLHRLARMIPGRPAG